MSYCDDLLTSGILKDCSNITAAIGVEKDLILVNYEQFDRMKTLLASNRETDNTNGNEGGLTNIELKSGAVQYVFEGTDYSVVPTVTAEVKEDGNAWFIHSIAFTVYNKNAQARKTLEELSSSLVVAIAVDRSTQLYEIFGIDQGLKLTGVERAYVGSQTSNFYVVTLATPDVAVVRESTVGELAVNIRTETP